MVALAIEKHEEERQEVELMKRRVALMSEAEGSEDTESYGVKSEALPRLPALRKRALCRSGSLDLFLGWITSVLVF